MRRLRMHNPSKNCLTDRYWKPKGAGSVLFYGNDWIVVVRETFKLQKLRNKSYLPKLDLFENSSRYATVERSQEMIKNRKSS